MTKAQKPKKTGRPRLPKGQAKITVFQIRIKPEEKAKFENAAKISGQTVSDWARNVLKKAAE